MQFGLSVFLNYPIKNVKQSM